MKKLFVVLSFCLMWLHPYPVFAYKTADNFRFPLKNYVPNCNGYWGVCNIPNKRHLGEDVIAKAGTAVYAIANGVIKEAQSHRGYGGTYLIEHTLPSGERVVSLYGHLNLATFVKKAGQNVEIGEYLGKVGTRAQNGGWAEHLHLAIHKGKYESKEIPGCGWNYAGYTTCSKVKNDWYIPSDFISKHRTKNNDDNYINYFATWQMCGAEECDIDSQTFSNGDMVGWYPKGECTCAKYWFKIKKVNNRYRVGKNLSWDEVCICR